jgi:methanogenic corrinoid protein MtbC1
VEAAGEVGADVIAMSTLMSTTMGGMRKVIELLEAEGVRDHFKVLVGGCPLSPAFADAIGADAYGENATAAIRLARQWTLHDA